MLFVYVICVCVCAWLFEKTRQVQTYIKSKWKVGSTQSRWHVRSFRHPARKSLQCFFYPSQPLRNRLIWSERQLGSHKNKKMIKMRNKIRTCHGKCFVKTRRETSDTNIYIHTTTPHLFGLNRQTHRFIFIFYLFNTWLNYLYQPLDPLQ